MEEIKITDEMTAKIEEISKYRDNVYIVNIEVGELDNESTLYTLLQLKKIFDSYNIKAVYVPTHNGVGTTSVEEVKEYIKHLEESEKEN